MLCLRTCALWLLRQDVLKAVGSNVGAAEWLLEQLRGEAGDAGSNPSCLPSWHADSPMPSPQPSPQGSPTRPTGRAAAPSTPPLSPSGGAGGHALECRPRSGESLQHPDAGAQKTGSAIRSQGDHPAMPATGRPSNSHCMSVIGDKRQGRARLSQPTARQRSVSQEPQQRTELRPRTAPSYWDATELTVAEALATKGPLSSNETDDVYRVERSAALQLTRQWRRRVRQAGTAYAGALPSCFL